ncbi:hypothetical protein ACA910_017758 [Epithemia clementina (nom. ined.)]
MDNNDSNNVMDVPIGHHSLSHAYSTYLAHDEEEQSHWEDVCRSYRQYATFAMAQWASYQYRLQALPEDQRSCLPAALRREAPEFQERARLYKEAAIRNQFCLDCILRHIGQPISQDVLSSKPLTTTTSSSSQSEARLSMKHSTDAQMSKVSSVLKSLVRDWSVEGKQERDLTYKPMMEKVQRYLPTTRMPNKPQLDSNGSSASSFAPSAPRLCIPGAGVGRLACELAALGYDVQGNEFSLYMLLASDFILNGGMATPDRPLRISPYLLESRNVHSSADPSRPIAIPDVDPYQMIMSATTALLTTADGNDDEMNQVESLTNGDHQVQNNDEDGEDDGVDCQPRFSMAAGEFVSIYSNPREKDSWDGFVACFFLDTAPCIVEYITVMHHCLKPGGFVFHFGPLLWHWSGPAMRPDDKTWDEYENRYSYLDPKYMTSVDFSWEDVRAIFLNVGFEIVEENIGSQAMYTSDRRSMMNMTYHCVEFVARKKCTEIPLGATTEASSSDGASVKKTESTSLR